MLIDIGRENALVFAKHEGIPLTQTASPAFTLHDRASNFVHRLIEDPRKTVTGAIRRRLDD